jgi:hypothetical protein
MSIVLSDLSFSFPNGRVVLSKLNASFNSGRTGLIGADRLAIMFTPAGLGMRRTEADEAADPVPDDVPIRVAGAQLTAALDQLLGSRGQLTRVLLGGQRD